MTLSHNQSAGAQLAVSQWAEPVVVVVIVVVVIVVVVVVVGLGVGGVGVATPIQTFYLIYTRPPLLTTGSTYSPAEGSGWRCGLGGGGSLG